MKIHVLLLTCLALGISLARAQTNDSLPELRDARVSIPYQELKALWQAAQPKDAEKSKDEKPKPPVAAVLLSARYDIQLGGAQAEGVAEFETQTFTDTWTTIPLLGDDAQLDGIEPADAQVIAQDGAFALVTNHAGKVTVKLRFAVKLDGAAFNLTTPGALVKVLHLTKIPEGSSARIADATQIFTEKEGASFRLPAREAVTVEIVQTKTLTPPMPSKWKIETQAFVRAEDGKLRYTARVAANTDAGSASEIDIRLSAAARFSKLSNAGSATWSVTHSDDQTQHIQIRWPGHPVFQREFEMEYEMTQPAAAGDWKLRAPEAEGGATTDAVFAIVGEEGIELTAANPGAAARRLPRWLAERSANQTVAIIAGDGAVRAKTLPLIRTTRAVIETAAGTTHVVTDGSLLAELTYSIRHDTPLGWQLQLPKTSELIACTVDGVPTNPVKRDGETIEFHLTAPGAKGVTEIKLSYTGRKPAFKPVSGQLQVELPLTDLLIHKLDWELHIPAAFELAALQGNVETVAGPAKLDEGSRVIRMRKELCKSEAPTAEIFYQKPEPGK